MKNYKADLMPENEHRPNCDQCDRPAKALLDGWPLCGEHYAQYRRGRVYRPALDQSPVRLDGETVAAALTQPLGSKPVVSARVAIEALRRQKP